jgi:hypothetical protein
MIVPAVRQYLTEQEVAALRPDDAHRVDSGMGGSFHVRFVGQETDRFVFENVSEGWERQGPYRYTFDEVRRNIYDLIPENPAYREAQHAGKTMID